MKACLMQTKEFFFCNWWGSSLVLLTPIWDGDDVYALASNTTNLEMLVKNNTSILSFLYISLLSFKNVLSWYHNVIFFVLAMYVLDLFIFLISISFMICNINWKWVFFAPLLHSPKNKDEIVNVRINIKRHHIHANK